MFLDRERKRLEKQKLEPLDPFDSQVLEEDLMTDAVA